MASLIDGERVILRATLTSRWTWWRFCTCSGAFAQLWPVLAPLYFCCGYGARKEEASSFDLTLTATAIHFSQKLYQCACCCQATSTKTIPLDKVQDVMIVSDCCGDCCGYVATPGAPYQLHVQTAGRGTPEAELSVYCVENIHEFRAAVLQAKRALNASAPSSAGADKVEVNPAFGVGGAAVGAADQAMVVRVLERIEAALNEGLGEMRAARASGRDPR